MTPTYTTVIFDLDGTLLRSDTGVLNAFAYAAERMGIAMPDGFDQRRLIGPPLHASFSQVLGVAYRDLDKAVAFFREYYGPTGVFESELYPGVSDLVAALHDAGARVCIATSKYEVMARKVLEHFGLLPYIAHAAMSDGTERTSGKVEMIRTVLAQAQTTAGSAVMIGDTKFDAQGAAQAGTAFIGVLYGYGTREEMENEGARRFADNVPDLGALLLR